MRAGQGPRLREGLIENAPGPVFVSDLEGKILQANDAVRSSWASGTGRRAVAVAVHQPRGAREFTAALREVVERRYEKRPPEPRAPPAVIPTTLNASALRDRMGR
jgi:hypothetical protein